MHNRHTLTAILATFGFLACTAVPAQPPGGAPAERDAPEDALAEQQAIEERRAAEQRRTEEEQRLAAELRAEELRAEQRRADAQQRAAERRTAAERRRAQALEEGELEQNAEQQEQLRRQLEEAQAALEGAARDVARLSAQLAAPLVGDVTRRLRSAGARAMLGISIDDGDAGARVVGVSPNGPAAAAGLETGDVIVAIDGAELGGAGNQSPSRVLLGQMRNVSPGENVTLRVLRGDQEMDVTIGAREFEAPSFSMPDFNVRLPRNLGGDGPSFRWPWAPPNAWRSMELVPLTPELGAYFGTDRGILVLRGPDSEELGLRDGDVILDIGGREPTTPEHAMRILASFAPGETLRMTIMRSQQRETLELELPADDSDVGSDLDADSDAPDGGV